MNDVHALSGAYAVDAVDDIERAQFERHLTDCDDCRAEVSSLQEAAALLAFAVPYVPSIEMRDRILSEVATVRPLPPKVQTNAHRGSAARRRLPALVAAAAVVLAFGAGTAVIQPWEDDRPTQTISAAERVFSATDAESFAKIDKDGVSVAVARSASLNTAAIRTAGMPELGEDEVYQLWYQKGAKLVSAGLMDHGNGDYILEGEASDASQVLISQEAAGGEIQPKGSVVARIEFKQST